MSDTEETARSVKEGRTSTTEGSKPAEDLLAWREEVQRMNPARISKERDKITSDLENNDRNERTPGEGERQAYPLRETRPIT